MKAVGTTLYLTHCPYTEGGVAWGATFGIGPSTRCLCEPVKRSELRLRDFARTPRLALSVALKGVGND